MSPQNSDEVLVPGASSALDNLKMEVAQELGIPGTGSSAQYEQSLDSWKYEIAEELGLRTKVNQVGWSNMTSRECGSIGGRMGGKIGGNMVKRMIEFAERNLR